jgi:hypothetical protein
VFGQPAELQPNEHLLDQSCFFNWKLFSPNLIKLAIIFDKRTINTTIKALKNIMESAVATGRQVAALMFVNLLQLKPIEFFAPCII